MAENTERLVLTERTSTVPHVNNKRVMFQERAYQMGNIIGVNGYRVNRAALEQRLVEGDYLVRETAHFLVATQAATLTLVVHWFAPQAIDADLGRYFMEELKPLGLLKAVDDFGAVFGAVVGSVFPHNPDRAWHLFGVNTLERYHRLLMMPKNAPCWDSPIDVFATLYKRISELAVGDNLLDAGCSFGFLPLVIAERVPTLKTVVGIDLKTDPFPVTRAIAAERHLMNVEFRQADLLAADLSIVGRFDTVTVLHVLEHFSESEMYCVLANLLKVTVRRLIIGVPYEPDEPELAYGHKQLFTPAKLEEVGRWCLEQVQDGHMRCEDCAGGLLIIDLHS